MQVTHYNIHDILTFEVQSFSNRYSRLVENEYSTYRVSGKIDGKPDIKLILGSCNKPKWDNVQIVDKKYFISDRSIWARDSYKVAFWDVLIKEFDKETMELHFNGNLFSPYVLIKLFVEPLIRIKMMLKGYPMVHSCCLCDGSEGVVIPASPSTGKTMTLLNWISEGNPFVSDEYSILHCGKVYSFVTPFRFHSHNLRQNKIVQKTSLFNKVQIHLRTLLLKATRGFADITWNIAVQSALPGIIIRKETILRKIAIFTKWSGDKVVIKEIDKENAIRRMVAINFFEFRQFKNYINAFGYIYPDSPLSDCYEQEKIAFRNALGNCSTFSVKVPSVYNRDTYNDIITGLF